MLPRHVNWLKRKEQPKTEEQVKEQEAAYEEGLTRTRRGFFRQVVSLFEVDEITEDIWEELETLLIQADLGVDTTVALVEHLRERVRIDKLKKPQYVYEALQEELTEILLKPERDLLAKRAANASANGATPEEPRPYVILVVGVNGVGKTTTIAKLAKYLPRPGQERAHSRGRHLPRRRHRPARDLGRARGRSPHPPRAGSRPRRGGLRRRRIGQGSATPTC